VSNDNYEEYRLRAAYCREMSRALMSPRMQAEWYRLANTWLAMIPNDPPPQGYGSAQQRAA